MWEMCKLSDIAFIGLVRTAQSCCFSSLKVLVYFDVSNPKREKIPEIIGSAYNLPNNQLY